MISVSLLLLLSLLAPPRVLAQQPELPRASAVPGEGIYPRPSRVVWEQAKALLQTAGFRVERQDNKHQIFVTQWRNYDAVVLPDSGTLGLDPRDRVKKLQLHLMVSPDHEPVRLAIGSIVELERREGNRTSTILGYRVRSIEDWFLERLDERVGAKHEPLQSTLVGRSEQAGRLGSAPACVPKPVPNAKPSPPVKVSEVRPIFPAQGYLSRGAGVQVRGMLSEHGTLNDLVIVDPSPQFAHFESSARAAASLWRFRPVMSGGCPVPASFTVFVTYAVR